MSSYTSGENAVTARLLPSPIADIAISKIPILIFLSYSPNRKTPTPARIMPPMKKSFGTYEYLFM